MALLPSEHLTENEIAAATLADQGKAFNPQQQFRVTWPAEPVVALAYMDQLRRSDALSVEVFSDLTVALDRSKSNLEKGANDRGLAKQLETLAAELDVAKGDASTQQRMTSLGATLKGIAARLR